MQPYRAAIMIVKTKLEIIDQELKFKCEHSPIHNIQSRIKSPQSILDKLERKGISKNFNNIKELNDIACLLYTSFKPKFIIAKNVVIYVKVKFVIFVKIQTVIRRLFVLLRILRMFLRWKK